MPVESVRAAKTFPEKGWEAINRRVTPFPIEQIASLFDTKALTGRTRGEAGRPLFYPQARAPSATSAADSPLMARGRSKPKSWPWGFEASNAASPSYSHRVRPEGVPLDMAAIEESTAPDSANWPFFTQQVQPSPGIVQIHETTELATTAATGFRPDDVV